MEETVRPIRGKHLHISDKHRRSVWGDMAALQASIEERERDATGTGIRVPLIVRAAKNGGYEIGAGARRFNAGTKAGLKTFPCIVRKLTDEQMVELQRDENADRVDLHPMDEAMLCKDLSDHGHDNATIAKRLGFKPRDVVRRLKLLALSPKARKAYVDGKFADKAALALASTADSAKQADVLANLDAGTLQPEEIPGYVYGYWTASLDNIPWRTSDEKLLPKAGPCTTCPKRSDVQRDLFDEGARGLRCLDVGCWRAKMAATYEREAKRPEMQIYAQPVESVFIPVADGTPAVMASSGMVDADAPCRYVSNTSWREAVFSVIKEGDNAPTIYLAKDQDGRPRFLMDEAAASRFVKKSDLAKAEAAAERAADPVADEVAQTARAATRMRRDVVQRLAEILAADDYDTSTWVVERIIEGATARSLGVAAKLFADKITELGSGSDKPAENLAALATRLPKIAKRIAAIVMMLDTTDVGAELGQSVLDLAEICEVDLSAIEAELKKSAAA